MKKVPLFSMLLFVATGLSSFTQPQRETSLSAMNRVQNVVSGCDVVVENYAPQIVDELSVTSSMNTIAFNAIASSSTMVRALAYENPGLVSVWVVVKKLEAPVRVAVYNGNTLLQTFYVNNAGRATGAAVPMDNVGGLIIVIG